MSAIFHSGKNSSVIVVASGGGTNELASMGWSVNPSQEMASFKNSLTGTYEVLEPTFKSNSGSLNLDHNFNSNPFTVGGGNLTITGQGTSGTHLQLLYDRTQGTNASFWDLTSVFFTGVSVSDASEGKPTESFSFRCSGAWIEPV